VVHFEEICTTNYIHFYYIYIFIDLIFIRYIIIVTLHCMSLMVLFKYFDHFRRKCLFCSLLSRMKKLCEKSNRPMHEIK